jgi:hypothetical protein
MEENRTNKDDNKNSYNLCDSHLRRLYGIVRKYSAKKVILDNEDELFPEKSCPDAAIYCGWYCNPKESTSTPSPGRKVRSAFMWRVPKPPPCAGMGVRYGANER